MLRPIKSSYLLLILCLFILPSSYAQDGNDEQIIYQPNPDSPILERHPSLTGEGEAFDFLIGDWDVVITWQPKGSDAETYGAKWHNHWVVDGRVVMQEWRGPKTTGAEFRFYDKEKKSWFGRNIYADGAWRNTAAHSENGNMIVIIYGHNEARGDFLNRETYYNIKNDSFEMMSEISMDDGNTWEKGDYSMIVSRTIAQ